MKRRIILAVLLGFMIVLGALTGCSGKKPEQPVTKKLEKITVTDSLGRKVEVPCPPKRIVALNSDVSEVISALGAADKIVGVTNTDDFPLLKNKTRVGQAFTPNVEKILELKPDIVFGYGKFLKPELAKKIEAAGIPVVYLDCYKPATMDRDIKTLGKILGKEKEGEEYVALFEKYMNLIKERTRNIKPAEKVRVYLEGYTDYTTVAASSGGAEMLAVAGGANIAEGEKSPYPKVTPEWVVAQNPQVIIRAVSNTQIPSGFGAGEEGMKQLQEKIMARTGWQKIKAVQDGRVYIISADIYTGPRAVVGVAYFAKWLYPELFKDLDPAAIHKEFLTRFHGIEPKGAWVYPSEEKSK